METLREIMTFVGFGTGSMRQIGKIVPLLNNDERTSMRAMIVGLHPSAWR